MIPEFVRRASDHRAIRRFPQYVEVLLAHLYVDLNSTFASGFHRLCRYFRTLHDRNISDYPSDTDDDVCQNEAVFERQP